MHTALTEVLGLEVPVIAAPMAKVSKADLAAAAAQAGGLGCVAAGKIAIERLAEVYREAAQQLEGNDRNYSALGIGVFNYNCSKELLQLCIDLKPRAIWLSFGDVQPLAESIKAAGIKVVVQVQYLDDVEAALAAGADVIVGQSCEAGGHGANGASLVTLIPELVDHVQSLCQKLNIQPAVPVVAAGGIADARQAAAAFALGADGVALGTRLVPTYESVYPEDKKQALLQAGSDAYCKPVTVRTSLYDQINGEPWPHTVNGHCLRNKLTAQYPGQSKLEESMLNDAKQEHDRATAENTIEKLVVWSGSSVGLVKTMDHASDVITNLVHEMKAVFLRNAKLAGPRILGQ